MSFTLPPSLDKILQQQSDDHQALEKANAPRSQSRWTRWNVLAREKIHILVEKYWGKWFVGESVVSLLAIHSMLWGLLITGIVSWPFKIVLLTGMAGFCVFLTHFKSGIQKMKLKDRLETSWGHSLALRKNIDDYKTVIYIKTLLTQQQYTDLLHAMKQNAINMSNNNLREIAQYLIDTMDTTTPYFATLIAEKIEEEYKINAWSVVEAKRNTVTVQIEGEKGDWSSDPSKNKILKI